MIPTGPPEDRFAGLEAQRPREEGRHLSSSYQSPRAEQIVDRGVAALCDAGRGKSIDVLCERGPIVVDEQIPAVEVRSLIAQTGRPLLRKVELFDVYEGEQAGAGRKSLAYSLTYQADNRTLNAKGVSRIRTKIVRRLEREIGATLRA